ncbi:hypothetical protein ABEG96_12145, partial [Pantoea agglomerans]
LTDRRGWHILCRPAFRPRPAGSPGRLILFSAADCLPLIATGLRWPALRLARPEKKLARLTVTAFTNLILTDQYYAMGGLFLFCMLARQGRRRKIIIRLMIQACLWPVVLASYFNNIATMEPI